MIGLCGWERRLTPGWDRYRALLFAPTSGASLALFRICFGLVMAWQALSYLWPRAGGSLVQRYYSGVAWNFPYMGFEWVRAWPEPWVTLHFGFLALAGVFLALGLCYRGAAIAVFLGYTYVFLLEESRYNNHYYLMSLLAFLLIWMPAQRRLSLDAWLAARRTGRDPAAPAPPDSVPFWPVFLLRAQLFIVYLFGGVAKLDPDWLSGFGIVGAAKKLHAALDPFLALPDFIGVQEACLFLAWMGLAFDLSIGFLLLWRRTRILAILLLAVFHGTNNFLFNIGVFPVLAFTGTLIFLEPDWPQRFWHWLKRPRIAVPDWRWLLGGAVLVPVLGAALGWRLAPSQPLAAAPPRRSRLAVAFVCCWVAAQALLPLRHYFITGDASWTDEAHTFSWRMMLRSKQAADLVFAIDDPAVHRSDAAGKQGYNWANWPADLPPLTHMAVDSHRLDWRQLPAVMVIHEPALGCRIIYNPLAQRGPAERSPTACRAWVNALWQQAFGRQPVIHESTTLAQALAALRQHLQTPSHDSPMKPADRDRLVQAVELAQRLDPAHHANQVPDAAAVLSLGKVFRSLLHSQCGPLVRRCLTYSPPFAVQGAVYPDMPFLVVEDPVMLQGDCWRELRRLNQGQPIRLWVDLSRLTNEGWGEMPRALACMLNGQQRVIWNFHRDLTVVQIEKMSVRPFMLHQYCQRIADQWQALAGREPGVHVEALVALNHRTPQRLIDPGVDLAHVPYFLFRHNAWIMPLQGRLPKFADLQPQDNDEE